MSSAAVEHPAFINATGPIATATGGGGEGSSSNPLGGDIYYDPRWQTGNAGFATTTTAMAQGSSQSSQRQPLMRPTASASSNPQPSIANQQHQQGPAQHLPQQPYPVTAPTYYTHAPTYHAYPTYSTYPAPIPVPTAAAATSNGGGKNKKNNDNSKSSSGNTRGRKVSLTYPQYAIDPGSSSYNLGMGMGMASASTPALASQVSPQPSSSFSKRFGFRPFARRVNSVDAGAAGHGGGNGNNRTTSPSGAFASAHQQLQQQLQYPYGVAQQAYPGAMPGYTYWNGYPTQYPVGYGYDAALAGAPSTLPGQGPHQQDPHGPATPGPADLGGGNNSSSGSSDPETTSGDDSPPSPNAASRQSQRGLGGHQRKPSDVPSLVISPASPPPASSDLVPMPDSASRLPSSSTSHAQPPSGFIGSDHAASHGQGQPTSESTIAGVTYPKSPQPSVRRKAIPPASPNHDADPSPAIVPLPMSPSNASNPAADSDGTANSPRQVPLPFSPNAGPSSSLGSPAGMGMGLNRPPSRRSMRRATSPLSSSQFPPSSSQWAGSSRHGAAATDHVEQIGIIPAGIDMDASGSGERASGGVGTASRGAIPSFGGMVDSMVLGPPRAGAAGTGTGGEDEYDDDTPPPVVPMVLGEDFDRQHSHNPPAQIYGTAGGPPSRSNARSPEARGSVPASASTQIHMQQAPTAGTGTGGRTQRPGAPQKAYTLPYAPAPNAPGAEKWMYLPHASGSSVTGPPSRSKSHPNAPGGAGPGPGPGAGSGRRRGAGEMMRPQTSQQATNSSGSPLIDLMTPTDEHPPAPIPIPTPESLAAAAAGRTASRGWGNRFRPGFRRGKRAVGVGVEDAAYADGAPRVIPSDVVADLASGSSPPSSTTVTPTPQNLLPTPGPGRTPSPLRFPRLRRPSTSAASPSVLSPSAAAGAEGPSPMTAWMLAQQQQQQSKPSFVSRFRLRKRMPGMHPILTSPSEPIIPHIPSPVEEREQDYRRERKMSTPTRSTPTRSTPTRADYHRSRTTPTTTPTATANPPIIPTDVTMPTATGAEATGAGAGTEQDNRPPSLTPSDATISTATIHTPTSSGFQFNISPPTSYGKKAGAAVVAETNNMKARAPASSSPTRDDGEGDEYQQQYPYPFLEKPRRGRSGSAPGLGTTWKGKEKEGYPDSGGNNNKFYRGFPGLSIGRGTKRITKIIFSDDVEDPYFTFSNRSPKSVFYRKRLYPTAEHLFQAIRFMSPPSFRAFHHLGGGGQGAAEREQIVEEIRDCPTIEEAMAVARSYEHHFQRRDWQSVQFSKLEEILYLKFTQHDDLLAELIATHPAQLAWASSRDAIFGLGVHGNGRNELGQMLVRVRERLKEEGGL